MGVPKNIFFFWGNEKMSWMRYMTIKSFCQLNPDWKVKLYFVNQYRDSKPWESTEGQDFFTYDGANYFDNINKLNIEIIEWNMPPELKSMVEIHSMGPSHLSNFFKWRMLSDEGGIYSDLDILFVKPIDKFYFEISQCNTAICHKDWMSIGLLGSSGNNKFFEDLYYHTLNSFDPSQYQTAGVMGIYSMFNCEEDVSFDKLTEKYEGVCNFPYSYFYPYSCYEVESIFAPETIINDDAIGLHWFGGHTMSQHYNNLLTEDNYREYDTLFTRLIK
jgi:hypothetical protein